MKIYSFFLVLITVLSLSVKAQISGNALHFDGLNDYVDMGNAATFNVGNAVTYEAWINPDTTFSGFIIAKWVAFAEDIQVGFSGNKIFFYLHNVFGGIQLYSSPLVPLHQYTHIAATYDASAGIAKIYINGVFDASKSVGSSVSNSSGNLYFGFNPVRGDFVAPFKGIIDEVRIWNIARTESEIQSTMNQSLTGNETGLIGYWKFDEGTGSTTADKTTNGNDGTISGALWVPGVTDVKDENNFPESFSISQNYPNPFNPSTTIRYSIPNGSVVTIKVYDVLGTEVATLVNEDKSAGSYEVDFNASQLSSGIYFYKLQAGSFVETKKMILIK
ncbi:MAG: LamG-like jellyroll fold domain-containing protein [Ignavibacteriaceae bacterium]|nr:LamG-like jellyroll fold domain-containing protein [Ignavibacteriaceae bacterium]